MVRVSRREGLQLVLGGAPAVLLAAAGCQVRPTPAAYDGVTRPGRSPTPGRLGGYTPFPFVTTSNPPVDHTGVARRPGYSPSDPRSASVVDPMSGLELFRIGGDNGSTLFIDGTQNSGLKFPRRLRQENNPRMQKVWNADATLLMIDRRYAVTGDPTPSDSTARSFLVDVTGSYTGRAWRIIRASNRQGLGDRGVGQHWFWDMLNPLRVYVIQNDGLVDEWWPVGGAGHSVGERNNLFDASKGGAFTDFYVRRGSLQTSHDGIYFIGGCRRVSDNHWGGYRINLTTGATGPFVPKPEVTQDAGDRLAGISAGGNYGWFDPGDSQHYWYNVVTGEPAGDSRKVPGDAVSHFDNALVDGVEYAVGHRNGFKLMRVSDAAEFVRADFPGVNPQHTSCRNWKDTFENHGAVGGSTSGLRYAIWARSGPDGGHPRGIMGIRLGASDYNVVRYLCNHRSVRTTNGNECHPNVSPNVEYLVFNSNWHEPGLVADGDVHPYVVIVPDAWRSPNNDGS